MEYNNALYHHGIKGMRWGVRRYQNKDGSLTPAGQKRRAKLEGELEKLGGKKKTDDNESGATVRKKSISEMSNKELQEYTTRMQLEKNYYDAQRNLASSMPPKQVSAGEKFAKQMVDEVLIPAAKDAGKKYLDQALKKAIGGDTEDTIGALTKVRDKLKLQQEIDKYKNPDKYLSEEDKNKRQQRAFDAADRAAKMEGYANAADKAAKQREAAAEAANKAAEDAAKAQAAKEVQERAKSRPNMDVMDRAKNNTEAGKGRNSVKLDQADMYDLRSTSEIVRDRLDGSTYKNYRNTTKPSQYDYNFGRTAQQVKVTKKTIPTVSKENDAKATAEKASNGKSFVDGYGDTLFTFSEPAVDAGRSFVSASGDVLFTWGDDD
jgi:hypothetical protein